MKEKPSTPASENRPLRAGAEVSAPSVLIVDSDAHSGQQLQTALSAAGCHAALAKSARDAMRQVSDSPFDVAIVDEDIANDTSLLKDLGAMEDAPMAIVVSAFGTVEGAVNAMRRGAQHYASKPVSGDEITLAVCKAAEHHRLRSENARLRRDLDGRHTFGSMVVHDARMREICKLSETVAQTRATVLILGESGCGKSLLARAIHQNSPRKNGPFVEVNCGALPENLLESELFGHARGSFTGAVKDRAGRFEAANGGTIFLDEIGTAPASLQVRLLRVLQDRVVERVGEDRSRPIDVRVILATNHDLETAVREGRFREDLYYRIHVVSIELPPLRERPSDIPDLARIFLQRASESLGRAVQEISSEAMEELLAYSWPGNVRELENAMERAVAVGRGGVVEVRDLPPEIRRVVTAIEPVEAEACPITPASHSLDDIPLGPLEQMLAACEIRFLQRALVASGDNRTRAAQLLGLHRATLYQRMRRVGLDPQRPHQA